MDSGSNKVLIPSYLRAQPNTLTRIFVFSKPEQLGE